MSADAYADANGRLVIRVECYNNSLLHASAVLDGLKPYEPVQIELLAGTDYFPADEVAKAQIAHKVE